MGKVNRGSLVSARRRLVKASGSGGKKSRTTSAGKINLPLPPPPPSQSLVLDEDSGFGGDQSLDSESSLASAPNVAGPGMVLPSLAMVPQAVVEGQLGLKGENLQVDLSGEEAQELPASQASAAATTHTIPPLVSFGDVSLLSSLQQFKGNNSVGNPPMLRVDGTAQTCGLNSKMVRPGVPHSPPPLTTQLSARSSDGSAELKLVTQPEEQHRARYQTEGSRGAVKDRSGTAHPTVRLVGYNKPTTLQIFVGSDTGKSGPHMFYQVCRVSGKNSTPCRERRVDGTVVIEAALQPDNDMTMSCDCVGILKERNVDVEHRFKAVMSRGRKKSTKCRLVFRTFITLPSGAQEVLQVVSQPIACTQPPGVPEICRKSISSCVVSGGEQIFIFGKNFLKDTVVVFQQNGAKTQPIWEEKVLPDKDSLQPIHLIVAVPKYYDLSVTEEVTVEMMVVSGGKKSEPQNFTYLPLPTKKEVQVSDTWEDKPLPKGVSPCALQLNRHFAETGTLPQHMAEVAASHVIPSPSTRMPSGVTSAGAATAPVATSPVRTSRVMLSSAKKIVGRASRLASRNPRQSPLTGRAIRSNPVEPLPTPVTTPATEAQESRETELPTKVPTMQGTVSLESLVEMLKVVQKFPAESNLYTSVLQLVERLIHSMKDNIGHQCKTEAEEEPEAPNLPVSPKVAASCPPAGSYLLSKGQKLVPGSVAQGTQVSHATSYPPTNMAIPMATPVSLFPLTVFSAMPSTVSSGPKVARVAPVAPVAPTTVVSSPGLTRAVRVCVAEAPHLEEPPLKKQREEAGLMPDYTLVRGSQFASEPQMPSTGASAVSTASPASTTFSTVNPLLSSKIVGQCTSQEVLSEAAPAIDALQGQMRISDSQEVLSAPAVHLAQPPVPSPPQNVFRPLDQSVLQNVSQNAPQQQQQHQEQQQQQQHHQQCEQHEQEGQQQGQAIRASQPSATSLPRSVAHHHLSSMSEGQIVRQHSNQPVMGVQPDMHVPVSDPLLSQGPGLCGVLPSSSSMAPAPASQETVASTCVTSSALTRSDPLLSQSSPVTPIQMEAGPAIPTTNSESRSRAARTGDALMTPNPNSQVSMQNEVSSAINLSETELLNYFDPNCFDNV